MTPKEKFDACAKLADLAAERHNSRRDYEWKVSLGLWGALLASATIIHTSLPLWSPFALTACYVVSWLIPLWRSNANDKSRFDHFFSQGVKLLTSGVHVIEIEPPRRKGWALIRGYFKDWSMWFQTLVTWVIAMLMVLKSRGHLG